MLGPGRPRADPPAARAGAAGDAAATLAELDEAHALGIDPGALLRGLMEELHAVTRAKAGGQRRTLLQSAEEREAAERARRPARLGADPPPVADAAEGAGRRPGRARPARGGDDGAAAPDPRRRYARSGAVLSRLAGEGASTLQRRPQRRPQRASASPTAPRFRPISRRWSALLEEQRQATARRRSLHDHVGLVRFAPPELVLKPLKPLGADWPRELAAALKDGHRQAVAGRAHRRSRRASLLEQEKMAEERVRAEVLAEPATSAPLLEAFPEATLESFARPKGA